MRKIGLGFLLLLLAVPSYAQFPFSSKAIREFNNALTQGSIFGSPRYTTAALPLCDGSAGGLLNTGAVAYDTTAATLKFCTGSAWTSAGGGGVSLSGTNVWTAKNTFNDGASGLTVANVGDATKNLVFNLGGNSTTIVSTVAFSDTATSTHTVPAGTGTIAQSNSATSFTAKNTFLDTTSGFEILNTADNTKILDFDLSGITTGNTIPLWVGGTAAKPLFGFNLNLSLVCVMNNTGGGNISFANSGAVVVGDKNCISSNNLPVTLGNSSFTSAGALQVATQAIPTINQSGTASYTAFLLNPTVTGTGSGTNRILDIQRSSTSIINVDDPGHLRFPGRGTPTVTAACGTSPTVTGSDHAFQLNVGTGGAATTCTVTFNQAWGFKPVCVVSDETNQVISTTAVPASATIVFTASAAWTGSSILDVICIGNQ